jgi:hypothetical protein
LELRGFTISERDYETHLARTFAENPVGFAYSCTIFEGLDADQVATMLYSDEDEEDFPATATIVPGQEGDPDDMRIAAEMILERCQSFED